MDGTIIACGDNRSFQIGPGDAEFPHLVTVPIACRVLQAANITRSTDSTPAPSSSAAAEPEDARALMRLWAWQKSGAIIPTAIGRKKSHR
jgi:hypothetical protein